MRKLVLSMVISLDGFVDAPGGEFVAPDWSADLDGWTDSMVARFDTLLYGRAAWELMAARWPAAARDAGASPAQQRLAAFMNASRKIVFSRRLKDTSAWENSVIASASLADTIAAERAKPGRDMVVFAGAKFAQTAIRAGVVDEYWLLTLPMLFGGGSRLFEGHCQRERLALLEARPLDTGAVFTRHAVLRPEQ